MTNKEILQADLLDILFENRNKAYGAYALRKNYPNRLAWALGSSLALTLVFVFFRSGGSQAGLYDLGQKPGVIVRSYVLPAPKPVEKIIPVKTQVEQVKHTRIDIVPDDMVPEPEVPTERELISAAPSMITMHGVSPEIAGTGPVQGNSGSGKQEATVSESQPILSSSEASFPGGVSAFAKFLTRYLVTPGELAPGEKKNVLIRFMVDVEGKISGTEILQSDGEQYTKEVLRVIAKMPNWVPAVQNGKKVSAWFSQPVSFIGVEQ